MIRAFATVLVLLLSSVAGFDSLSGSAAEIPDPGDSATTPVAKGEASADPAHGQVDEIIVVCKTHFDLGYTHRVKDLLHYYRTTMIDRALGIMEASADLPPAQQFVWTSPGWVMERVLDDWPGQTPERRRRIETAFQSGKFVTHALPFSIGAELLEPEQFARGYVFADTISRRYGLPLARGAKTTDVPSQSRALATGLAHGGVKFMHIGCNWPSGYVHDLPPIFWWQGPDGSRVLTMYSSIYGTCTAFWAWGGKTDRNIGQNLLPPADWPYKTWVAIIVTGDNSGPPRADGVQAIFAEAARKLPGARVRMGTMEEFAVALLAENPDLPVVKGEMPDTWIHGCMSDPGGMRTARNVAPRMSAAETLNTHLRSWGVAVADPVSELARAHEQALLYNEHTWGGAAGVRVYGDEFQKLPPQQHANLEGSWEDKTDYIRTADRITAAVLERDLASLAQAVKCAGPRAVVFNPLPWPRSGLVQLADRSFLADDVPGCGYKTFPIPAASAPAALTGELLDGDTLENEFLQVKLDAVRGGIVSLVDQRTGRQWADANAAHSLGQYLNERFDKLRTDGYCRDYQQGRWGDTLHSGMHKPGLPADVPYRAACSNGGALTITRDAVGQSAVLTFPARPGDQLPASALRVTLYRGQPYLDIELSIRDKARDNWPEADWLCLPFKIDEPQFRVARSLGVMDPAQDILRGANRDLYAVGAGVTLTDSTGAGIAVCPLDHPLISLDTPGCWKFSLDFVPRQPVVFLNLYNNQWNTNYRYWYPGTWSSRVRVWTFAAGTALADALINPALEARYPLLAASADGGAGNLPREQAGLTVSRRGVVVSAFGADPAGSGRTLLRVWEQAGNAGEVTVRLPAAARFSKAWPVNLRGERAGAPLEFAAGQFVFPLNAYAPASFLFE